MGFQETLLDQPPSQRRRAGPDDVAKLYYMQCIIPRDGGEETID